MADDMKDLPFLDKTELLMRLATQLEKTRSNAQLTRLILELSHKRPEVMSDAPPDVRDALHNLPDLEDRMLELRSLIHWLTRRRD